MAIHGVKTSGVFQSIISVKAFSYSKLVYSVFDWRLNGSTLSQDKLGVWVHNNGQAL